MAKNTELRINLAALKRQDPYIKSITDSSTHVAVYSFSPQSNEWEKTDVEGTLFVYERVAPPMWGFTIMNRLSMENLTEPLTSELEFQTQNPFLLYRNAKLLIYGIWFYDQDDCKRVGELLEKLCREPLKPMHTQNVKSQRINLFATTETVVPLDPAPISVSPNSNSVTSISPGSSVGGIQRPPSNIEEADSESDDKEVAQNNKASVNILDLLSKAQDKYEKEKRNTPDPSMDILQNGTIISPTDAERPLMKPVPVKPSHPQKLDVASLFKQLPAKSSDSSSTRSISSEGNNPLIPNPTMPGPYPGMIMPHPSSNNAQSANINIPQQPRRPHMTRSFSMTEMALRQHIGAGLNSYMNGSVMSVEEVEASLNQNSATSRQQQVNSTLDRLIDRINSTGCLPNSGPSLPPTLPGIQENAMSQPATNTSSGNSGSMVVNGNSINTVFSNDDVFTSVDSGNPFPTSVPRYPNQLQLIPTKAVSKQRSVSTSSIQPPQTGLLSGANSTTLSYNPQPATIPSAALSNLPIRNEPNLLLHGNAVISKESVITSPTPSLLVATTASSAHLNGKNKVPVSSLSNISDVSSPSISATLISPDDFVCSATTPQKKLELKNRLLRDVPSAPQSLANANHFPLTKEQLQQTLVSLLKNDPLFLAGIHNAYMTNFNQS